MSGSTGPRVIDKVLEIAPAYEPNLFTRGPDQHFGDQPRRDPPIQCPERNVEDPRYFREPVEGIGEHRISHGSVQAEGERAEGFEIIEVEDGLGGVRLGLVLLLPDWIRRG